MYTVFDIVMIPLQLLIIFFTLYYFFVSWFGLFGKKKEVKIYDESKTFALIACAWHALIAIRVWCTAISRVCPFPQVPAFWLPMCLAAIASAFMLLLS